MERAIQLEPCTLDARRRNSAKRTHGFCRATYDAFTTDLHAGGLKQFVPQIAIDSAVFPEGTSGQQLDVLARKALWKEGYNYLVGLSFI